MYTNIPTRYSLCPISNYLLHHACQYTNVKIEALIEALIMFMLNNVFSFGDTNWHRVSVTTIGTNLDIPYITTFFAIHKYVIHDYLTTHLTLCLRFIDSVIRLCIPAPGVDDDTSF